MLKTMLSLLCLFANLSATLTQEFLFKNPPFPSCHASTLAQTLSGKLLCAYFAGSEEGAKDVAIYLSTQTEKGWSEPRLIASNPEAPCWNPVLFTLPSGEILLFYKVGPQPNNWSGVMRRSQDEGLTWSEETPLPAGIIGPAKNKPLLLSDGTLLCGSSTETWQRWGCYIDITPDLGKSWSKSEPINLKDNLFGLIQPTLFFSPRGELRLLARSKRNGFICTATSYDKGKSWTQATPTNLPNPNSGIDAVQLRNGEILLVYNHTPKKRTPLNIALSKDGGLTWEPLLALEEGLGEFSYPSVIQTADGYVHITYTFNRTQIKHVVLEPMHFERSKNAVPYETELDS